MGLLDDIGGALDRPWSASGATPEQISTNPWARRGLVLSALGNNIIPPWEQGHRNFGTSIAAHGTLARNQAWENEQRNYALQQQQLALAEQQMLAQHFAQQPQQGPQTAGQAALGAPGLGPPGPTVQRAVAASAAPGTSAAPVPGPTVEAKQKAELYRQAAYKLSARNPEKAKTYLEFADKLDPKEEYFQAIEGDQGLTQFSKYGSAPRVAGVGNKPDSPSKDYIDLAKIYGRQPTFEELKEYKKSGAASQSVTVAGEKSMLTALGTGLGKQLDESLAIAKSALPSIDTAQQIRRALDSGKVIAGPGSDARVALLQIGQVLGVGGKSAEEVLGETRRVIQGLAKAELDAAQLMKGQGQITEAERDIIRRAAAGNISGMTVPELRILSDLMEKTARFKISSHTENVKRLGALPEAAAIAPFYNSVQAPPAYEAVRAPQVRQAPRGALEQSWLKKYGVSE